MRGHWVRISATQIRFLWTFHHALLDGRSFPIVLREVFASYSAIAEGKQPEISAPRPYEEFITWLENQDWNRSEAFWRQQLQGLTAPGHLSVEGLEAKVQGTEPDYHELDLHLGRPATDALKSFAQSHALTPNTVVQAAWAILLSRYSGETDVVFGATRAGRHSTVPGAEAMVGLFINTVPVRTGVAPETNVLAWLGSLRQTWVDIRSHEHVPLARIQSWSPLPRGTALFDSIVVFENYLLNDLLREELSGWAGVEFQYLGQTNFGLTVMVYSGADLLLRIGFLAEPIWRRDDSPHAGTSRHPPRISLH